MKIENSEIEGKIRSDLKNIGFEITEPSVMQLNSNTLNNYENEKFIITVIFKDDYCEITYDNFNIKNTANFVYEWYDDIISRGVDPMAFMLSKLIL